MFTLASIRDLHAHMEWADATVWKAVQSTEPATQDVPLRELLFHVHQTQEAFLSVWTGRPFDHRIGADAYPTLSALRARYAPQYADIHAFLKSTSEQALSAPAVVPWAKFYARRARIVAADTTLGETLVQLALHSQYHRGQVNRRLREVGGEPPLVDYIAWLWAGRPAPAWG
jgi:uncharacterized damage-inducible protein DinB